MKYNIENGKSLSVFRSKNVVELWVNVSYQLEMEFGLYVSVKDDYDELNRLTHIWFEIEGHKFETLQEAKRALEQKGFL